VLRDSPVLRFTSGSLRIVCIVVTPLWKLIMHTAARRFSRLSDKIQRPVAQIPICRRRPVQITGIRTKTGALRLEDVVSRPDMLGNVFR